MRLSVFSGGCQHAHSLYSNFTILKGGPIGRMVFDTHDRGQVLIPKAIYPLPDERWNI